MRLYFLMALLLAFLLFYLYFRYRREKDLLQIGRYLAAIGIAVFFTYMSKMVLVHKPVFVVHLALLILSWIGVFFYLFRERLIWWLLLAPSVTTLFFIFEALFFRENG
jgi:hypothetical protein